MKIIGKQWSDFCKVIPDCFYFDDSDYPTDYALDDVIEVTCGNIDWQGPRSDDDHKKYVVPGVIGETQVRKMREDRDVLDLLSAFRRWLKSQTVDVIAVEVLRQRRGELEALLKTIGAKVVK